MKARPASANPITGLLNNLDGLTAAEITDVVNTLPPHVVKDLIDSMTLSDDVINLTPLPHQRPPEADDWTAWVLATGRGGGKSFAAMLWLADYAEKHPYLRGRIIAPTLGDAIASCVEGPNGLLTRSASAVWKPSAPGGARVEWPNGAKVWVLGTPTPRDVDRLRALTNCDIDVFEEAAANPMLEQAADQARLSRRGSGNGYPLRWVATTTPRPLKIMREWERDENVHYVKAPSSANTFADPAWLQEIMSKYPPGSRLYRQEILGEIIDDVEGALWKHRDIDRSYVDHDEAMDAIVRCAVGVDPPSGGGTCGIIAVGVDADNRVYVLADYSLTDVSPHEWATAAITAAQQYDAVVVAEVNQGGRMVTETLQAVEGGRGVPIKTVHAAKGKTARAEPIAVLWEADDQIGRLAPVKREDLGMLVDQLLSWEGSFSPDRLDAMVWACTHLRGTTFDPGTVATRHIKRQLPGW